MSGRIERSGNLCQHIIEGHFRHCLLLSGAHGIARVCRPNSARSASDILLPYDTSSRREWFYWNQRYDPKPCGLPPLAGEWIYPLDDQFLQAGR